MLYQTL